VAADNPVAIKLYRKCGYEVAYKTDDGLCNCLMSRLFKSFLGHPVWHKMSKQLSAPGSEMAVTKPEVASMVSVAATASSAPAVAAASQAASQPAASAMCRQPCAAERAPEAQLAAEPSWSCCGDQGAVTAECLCKIPAHNAQPLQLPLSLGTSAGAKQGEVAPGGKLSLGPCSAEGTSSDPISSSGAAPLMPLAKAVSNSAAAASIVHLARRASEREGASV
jgi:hypothetical protein